MGTSFKDSIRKFFATHPLKTMMGAALIASGVAYRSLDLDLTSEDVSHHIAIACLVSLITILVAAFKLKGLSHMAIEKERSIDNPDNFEERKKSLNSARAFYGVEVALIAAVTIFLLVGALQKVNKDAVVFEQIQCTLDNTVTTINSISTMNVRMRTLQDSTARVYSEILKRSRKINIQLASLKKSYDSLSKSGIVPATMKGDIHALSMEIKGFNGSLRFFSDTIAPDLAGLRRNLSELKGSPEVNQAVPGIKPE